MTTNLTRRQWLAGTTTVAASSLLLSGVKASAQTFMAPNVNPTAENPIRAHLNENSYGQSLKARKAIADAADDAHKYAFEDIFKLIGLMAKLQDIPKEYVGIGAGSTEFLEKAAVFNALDGGDLLLPTPTYGDIGRFSRSLGSNLIEVPVGEDMAINLDAMRRAMTKNVKLIYLCNPNNPIPTIIEKNALKEFCNEFSPQATILIDEAYFEYVDNPNYESMIDLVKENKNIIVTRTASKIHAFAGTRIGVCYANPDIIKRMFSLFANTLNLSAMRGAYASYQDFEYQNFLKQKNKECQKIIYKMLDDMGLEYKESNANFLFFNAGRPSKEVAETMKKHHILTGREFKPFTNWVRLSLSKPEEMQLFADIYKREFG
ncbi:MAG: aminotransferase class I/II-fold pyridoxal phosphate-dependent enzyme [Alphaproteobacteria bacterium]|nr:aminotransferase class I/II-fold pyridoxal phosphate-dependent enzyme [Alphaproteobacteria bacterium]HPF45937.1 aminotransferase class I/II-fold pyridoxal phosphate-dependent enzyme [Emcibacteraceae bacterium]HRW29301.1 aminotransferase class I/II-fold pyridoxal phosphate-dependent enzyme [Emcibacteraceae bacterium]